MEETIKQINVTKIKTKRFYAIDILESVAIFFVVLYHSTLFDFNFLNNSLFVYYLRYFFRAILSTCVPLFFFANGFLLFNKEFNLKKHLLKMVKLILQFVVWSIITTLFLFVAKEESFEFSSFVKIIITLKSGWLNHFWFILALLCIYILFPLLKVVYDNNKKVFIYFMIIGAIFTFGTKLISIIITVFSKLCFNKIISFDLGFNILGQYGYSFIYFCLGGMFNCFMDKIKQASLKKKTIISCITIIFSCVIIFLLGVFFSYFNNHIYDVVWEGYDNVFTLLNTISIFILCLNFNKESTMNIFKLISTNTFGVYFIHWILIAFTRKYIKVFSVLCSYWFNILYAIILLLISVLISYLIKKLPIIKKIL